MKLFRQFILPGVILFIMTGTMLSCEDSFDNDTDADDFAIPLTVADTSVKAPGRGQYRLKVLSSVDIEVTADLAALKPLQAFTIAKTKNGTPDQTFGTNGEMVVDAASVDDAYTFVYTSSQDDVDQLIGFTFEAQSANGETVTSDLTLIVTYSPRDNIPHRRWAWTGKIWVDGGNVPDLKDCEKDNYTLFNADGTMEINYGEDTGSGSCQFDGFNTYQWELSEDEKLFVITSTGVFDGVVRTETYRVVTLTTDKIVLEIEHDLSLFGLGTEETYSYEYTALPK